MYTHNSSAGAFDELTIFAVRANGTIRPTFATRSRAWQCQAQPTDSGTRLASTTSISVTNHSSATQCTKPRPSSRTSSGNRTRPRFGVPAHPAPHAQQPVALVHSTRRGGVQDGRFEGRVYGGRYGDLGATIAAILLDREARSTVLDADPAAAPCESRCSGTTMRALEFESACMEQPAPYANRASGSERQDRTGTAPGRDGVQLLRSGGARSVPERSSRPPYLPLSRPRLESPSQYQPQGPGGAGSVSPEAQLANGPLMIGLLNGLTSLVNHGLSACEKGFGDNVEVGGDLSPDVSIARPGCATLARWPPRTVVPPAKALDALARFILQPAETRRNL